MRRTVSTRLALEPDVHKALKARLALVQRETIDVYITGSGYCTISRPGMLLHPDAEPGGKDEVMKILKATKAGIVGHIEGKPMRQYDDSITVHLDSEAERIANKTIEHEGTIYYYGTANRQHDNSYVALYWKTRPMW